MSHNFTNKFILNALDLPIISNLEDLADSIGISTQMIYLLSKKNERFYKEFTIEKRNRSSRNISSPTLPMKLVQKWILVNILEKIKVSSQSMAFIKGVSGCKVNAEYHHNNLYLLKLDLENFFDNIKQKRVYSLFRNLGYNSEIAGILSNICTLKDSLPQGGVTSPYISNLICTKLDRRLEKLCSLRDVTYTRYADDLAFSCDNIDTLKKLKNIIEDIIKDEDFLINIQKTKISSKNVRMRINGITLNADKLKVDKALKRKIRAQIHHMFLKADFSDFEKIKGYISYISSIEPDYKNKIIIYIKKLTTKLGYHEDIVNAFNKSGFAYLISNSMQFKGIKDFDNFCRYLDFDEEGHPIIYEIEESDFFKQNSEIEKRDDFLKKNNFKSSTNYPNLNEIKQIVDNEDMYPF